MKKNELINKIPNSEIVILTYIKDTNITYIVTQKDKKYFLYIVDGDNYKFLKSRSGNPLFMECYEEVF